MVSLPGDCHASLAMTECVAHNKNLTKSTRLGAKYTSLKTARIR